MRRRHAQQGSALLMAVGLLTVVAMLGAALFIVLWLDRQQTRAIASRSQADPIAQAVISSLVRAAADDLRIVDSNVYGGSDPGATGWLDFIDYACPYPDPNANVKDSFWNPYWYGTVLGSTTYGTADVDGYGLVTAPLHYAGVTNSLGERYYVAVAIADASGKISLNSAGFYDPNTGMFPVPTTPAAIDLRGVLGPVKYANVHYARAKSVSLTDYDTLCGRRLLEPTDANVFLPFAIGDEMCLRWLRATPTPAGRLWTSIGADANRSSLTTYNSSLVVPRRPATGFTTRLTLPCADANLVYSRTLLMLTQMGLGTSNVERRRMAAAFAANLTAYQTNYDTNDSRLAYHCTDGGDNFWAYGLTEDLVITEGYARHNKDDANTTVYHAYAIEIWNPTGASLDLSEYRLRGITGSPTLTGTLAANARRVILYHDATDPNYVGLPSEAKAKADANFIWQDKLSFLDRAVIRIERSASGPGPAYVPIDEISAYEDIRYDFSSVPIPGDTDDKKSWVSHRDDDSTRCRYNVAAYARSSDANRRTLGLANGLTAATTLDPPVLFPVPIRRRGSNVADIGELLRVFFAGRYSDGNDARGFPVEMARGTTLGALADANSRTMGRLDAVPTQRGTGSSGYVAGIYPDVPAGCLFSEFFNLIPPDSTRGAPGPFTRVYGRVNVNRATFETLRRLPYPAKITVGGASADVDPNYAAAYIAAYRSRTTPGSWWPGADPNRDYASRATGAGIPGLRDGTASAEICFLTPDEVAIPLADYANKLMGWHDYSSDPTVNVGGVRLDKHRDYQMARDSLFTAVSNLLTVNTSTILVNIRVQLGTGSPPAAAWHYVAVIDRGNCVKVTDVPAVLLFAEVK